MGSKWLRNGPDVMQSWQSTGSEEGGASAFQGGDGKWARFMETEWVVRKIP